MQQKLHCLDCGDTLDGEGTCQDGVFIADVGVECPGCGSDDLDPEVENPLEAAPVTIFGQLAVEAKPS